MKKNRFEIKCNKITKYKDNLGIEQKAEPNKNYLIYLNKKGFTFVQEYKDDVDVVSLITDLIDNSKDTIQSIKITKYKDNLGIEQKAEPNKNYLIYLNKKGFTFVQEYKDDVDVVSLITDLIDNSKDTIQSIKRIIEHQYDITQIVRYDYKNYYGVDIKRI